MIENIKIGLTVITVATTIITTILSIYGNKQTKKKQKVIELAKIVQKLPEYIKDAEQMFGAGKGQIKKNYVLKEVRNDCMLNEIEFKKDEFGEEVEKILETPQKKGE